MYFWKWVAGFLFHVLTTIVNIDLLLLIMGGYGVHFLKKLDAVKATAIAVRVLLSITGISLSFGVIWYERHSADIRYRNNIIKAS